MGVSVGAQGVLHVYDDSYMDSIRLGQNDLCDLASKFIDDHSAEKIIVFILHHGSYTRNLHHEAFHTHAGGGDAEQNAMEEPATLTPSADAALP